MDVIILAGGRGTRLKDVISDIPKPLAPINGKPFLDILLSQLNKFACIKKVILAVGYKAEMIMDRYKNCYRYNFKIVFSEEQAPLGTGGAIKKALALTDTEEAIILNGDSYAEIDIDDLLRFHKANRAFVTIVLKEVSDTQRYGSIKIDKQKRILIFEEKKNTDTHGFINAGIYVIKKHLLDGIENGKELSFEKQILPELIHKGAYGYVSCCKFIDIGLPETYKKAGEYLKELCVTKK